MQAQSSSLPSLHAVVETIFTTHRIRRQDQEMLMSLLLAKKEISMEEKALIDQIFEGLRRGTLRVG
ncbi:hypothetical protein [Trichothermofontia sp.]